MGDCDLCEGDDVLSYTCNECGGQFCSEHRLPEAHNCAFLQTSQSGTGVTPPRPSMPGRGTDDSPSILSTLFGLVIAPFILLYMLLTAVLRRWKLVILLGIVVTPVALASTGNLQSSIDAGEKLASGAGDALDNDLNQTKVEILVHDRINDIRRERGLRPLDHDPTLQTIASRYSKKMATQGFYGHVSPSGNDFQDRYEAAGYSCRVDMQGNQYATGAENIQYTFAFVDVRTDEGTEQYNSEQELAKGLVNAWMNSPGHRENILRPYWRNEGIGVYAIDNPEGPGLKVYATQNFC